MNRRHFLTLGCATVLSIWKSACGGGPTVADRAANPRRIVVIGAGLAGLAAARALHRQGHEVVVVEARDRIGGRIWTSTTWPEMPLDFGATWIHGVRGNPMTELADEIQADRLITRYDRAVTYNTSGKPLSATEAVRMEELRAQVFELLEQAQAEDRDTSIRAAIAPLMQTFVDASESSRWINFILSSELEHEYSGSAERLSAHWYDSGQAFEGDDALFVQGFRVITEFLARGLQIELGQVVNEIQWQQSPVRVITQKKDFWADQVVVTLPLGVLQSNRVRFTPALPDDKQSAIATLGMGVLNKCYLRFRSAFWPADVDWLEYVPTQHGEWTEWVSFQRTANLPVLLGFNAADRGREIETWSDPQIVESALQTLSKIFGADVPNPMDYQVTRWASDPFSLGAYSYNAVGATPAMRRQLAAPLDNRVFFAGEACEPDYFGTTHGAYLSGLRAAREILAV